MKPPSAPTRSLAEHNTCFIFSAANSDSDTAARYANARPRDPRWARPLSCRRPRIVITVV